MIAAGGFAVMAWNEACRRTSWHCSHFPDGPDMKRGWSPDYKYYEMLENAASAASAYRAAYKLGMVSDGGMTVTL